ncbi:MAG: YbaB/EbfC family nucleoid-associated protein [Armatimonadetes bacterium]|nr:YbaB/EbfC family nucleoid-associated protein [Armatimonadota bacterium]
MKLPKQFGGVGMGGLMQRAQEAMAKAQRLEEDLANERIEIDKGPVKATFSGTGELVKISLDKSVVDPEDIEVLEDLIVSTVRDGFTQATTMRNERVQEIMPNVPHIPGM